MPIGLIISLDYILIPRWQIIVYLELQDCFVYMVYLRIGNLELSMSENGPVMLPWKFESS